MTLKQLRERQSWSLAHKIDHSLGVIDQFISRTENKAYVAFSGGKDSTVLLHLCRIVDPSIKGVFINTGCEYPDIVKFVRLISDTWGNIVTLRPAMSPKKVWEIYGFPLVSKEVAGLMHTIRHSPDGLTAQKKMGSGDFTIAKRWRYLADAPYEISDICCDKLKKQPAHKFEVETGLLPIIGTMASESRLREKTYIKRGGCNVFVDDGKKRSSSLPLSIWNDDDIWAYIEDRKLPISEAYKKGLSRTGCAACGFGAGDARDTRFRLLYDTYPKYYAMVMNYENNGIKYREALKRMFAAYHRYLPDDMPLWMTH